MKNQTAKAFHHTEFPETTSTIVIRISRTASEFTRNNQTDRGCFITSHSKGREARNAKRRIGLTFERTKMIKNLIRRTSQ